MAMLRDLDQLQDRSGLQSKIADVGPQPNEQLSPPGFPGWAVMMLLNIIFKIYTLF